MIQLRESTVSLDVPVPLRLALNYDATEISLFLLFP